MAAGAEPASVLQVRELSKSFGATRALRSCSLALEPGEVHCLIGENGSGKSTLVKILAGIYRPDGGGITVDGEELALRTPRAASAAGIKTVFQEVLVVEPRSVLENVWMGSDGLLRETVSRADKEHRAAEVLRALLERDVQLDEPVERLSLSDRQACCVARALVVAPKLLVLDEATSALDVATRDRVLAQVRALAAQGTTVLFISHRMDEIAAIGDRCTVMRSGETVATLSRDAATATELVRLMTGDDHLTADAAQKTHRIPGEVVLEVPGLKLRAGELIGLAGLEGHGQDAFLQSLAKNSDTAYVPRERGAESLFPSKSVRENFGIVTLDRDRARGLLRPKRTSSRLASYIDRLAIKLASPEDQITTLSGGNQQKVVIARWLATDPKILLLNDPTRGIDLNAKRDLYGLLFELAGQGLAIVMLSTELDEHVELMDRVLVFRGGHLRAEFERSQLSRESILGAFFA